MIYYVQNSYVLLKITLIFSIPIVLEQYKNFSSKYVDPRNIEIWLPPDWKRNHTQRYPTIYMHDGQYLFKPITAWDSWGLQEIMNRLIGEGKIEGVIIVGIWNTPKRWQEYAPERAVRENISQERQAGLIRTGYYPISDDYLKFIVHELKPFVDASYPVLSDRKHTFIMGSSMGGIISGYAVCEYPHVFSGAACMSSHWPVCNGVMLPYLKESLPDPQTHKFYFDFSTMSLDTQYEGFQNEVDQIMKASGYTEGINWITKKIIGAEHDANSWGKRVDIPLEFFLSKK